MAFDPSTASLVGGFDPGSAVEFDAQEGGIVTDTGHLLKIGADQAALNVRGLVKKIPVVGEPFVSAMDKVDEVVTGKPSDQLLESDISRQQEKLTAPMQDAQAKLWWDSETKSFGPAISDPRSWYSGVVQSLPETALTMIPALRMAKAAGATAKAKAIASGATAAEAAAAASKAASIAAYSTGAIVEGGMGGAASEREVAGEIMKMPEDVLNSSEAYNQLLEQGLSSSDARKQLAEDVGTKAFIIGGVATGIFSGAGDVFLSKAIRGEISGGLASRMAKGAVSEGLLEEGPQGYLQKMGQNYALQDANKNQELTEGAMNESIGGIAAGGVMGAGFGIPKGAKTQPADILTAETTDEAIQKFAESVATDDAASQFVNDNIPAEELLTGLDDPVMAQAADASPFPTTSAEQPAPPLNPETANELQSQPQPDLRGAVSPELDIRPATGIGGGIIAEPVRPAAVDDQLATTQAQRDGDAAGIDASLPGGGDAAVGRRIVPRGAEVRRENVDLRQKYDSMAPEERAAALDDLHRKAYVSDLTGLQNKRAFEEHVTANPQAKVLYGDVDGLKALNTRYGHNGADQILKAVGEVKAAVASELGVNAFHRSGDEFLAVHPDPAILDSYGAEVQKRLDSATVEVTLPDGTVEKHVGIGLSYGVGENADTAEARAETQKAARKSGAVPVPAAGRNEDQPGIPAETSRAELIRTVTTPASQRVVTPQNPPVISAKPAETAQSEQLTTESKPVFGTNSAGKITLRGVPMEKIQAVRDKLKIKGAIIGKDSAVFPKGTDLKALQSAFEVAPAPAAPKPKKSVAASHDLLGRIKQLGGINSKYASDVTGEKRPGGAWRFAFGKNGLGLDDLASQLAAEGFTINLNDETDNGGVNQLSEMIRQHIGGERAFKAASQEAQAEAVTMDRARQKMESRATELGIKPGKLSNADLSDAIYLAEDAIRMEAIAAREAISDEGMAAAEQLADLIDDGQDVPFGDEAQTDDAALAAFLGEQNENDQTSSANTEESPASRAQESAERGARTVERPILESYTNAEVLAREEATKKAAEDASAEEAKAAADKEVGDFTLTGSDRAADVGAARGQTDIFSAPETKAKKLEVLRAQAQGKISGDQGAALKELADAGEHAAVDEVLNPAKPNVEAIDTPTKPVEKSAENGQNESKETDKGAALFEPQEGYNTRANPFYSQLARQIESAPDRVFSTGKSTALWLQANTSKLGIKKDELFWTGITDWLNTQGKVSKADVLAYLDGNGVQVKDVMLGKQAAEDALKADFQAEGYDIQWDNEGMNYVDPDGDMIGYDELPASLQKKVDEASKSYDDTKFAAYQLPGGENYRELLLTLPVKESPIDFTQYETSKDSFGDWQVTKDGRYVGNPVRAESAEDAITKAVGVKNKENPSGFISSHYKDQPNILAHIRFNERYSAPEPNRSRPLGENFFNREIASHLPLDVVHSGVIRLAHYDQVQRSVISALPVDVVDLLKTLNLTPKDLFSDQAVRASSALFGADHVVRVRIFDGLRAALRDTEASLRAKVINSLSTGLDKEVLPALRTSDLDTGDITRLLAANKTGESSLSKSGKTKDIGTRLTAGATGNIGVRGGEFNPTDLAKFLDTHAAMVAHNERGSKVLFIEEIQSDWGQKGKKEGFGKVDTGERVIPYTPFGPQATEAVPVFKEGVPSAPFVTDTKSWTALALKRMIAYAVENGFDRVAWTTGEQQAARYDLSKQIARVEYTNDGRLLAYDKNTRNTVIDKEVAEKDIEDYIGKDAAGKILAAPVITRDTVKMRVIEGGDLKVGGEGMKGYYDQIVPQVANDILKKMGGKVEAVRVETYAASKSPSGYQITQNQQGFTITPEMRAKVLNEGLALFAPKAAYNENQSDLFADPYDTLETRPGTTEAQLDAGRAALAAVEKRIFSPSMRGRASVLGSAISKDFRDNGYISLVGQKVTSSGDLALVAQVLRDPRFETFRTFYIKDGKIVGERAYTSRLAGQVSVTPELAEHISADVQRTKADGYWLLHNHPSGAATASQSDLRLTEMIAGNAPGLLGHVIIDHNEYNNIEVFSKGISGLSAEEEVIKTDLGAISGKPEVAHALLGSAINAPRDAAAIAKHLQKDGVYSSIIGRNAQGKVSMVLDVPALAEKNSITRLRAAAMIRRAARETGAVDVFAIVPSGVSDYKHLWSGASIFRDVISAETGESAAERGYMSGSAISPSKVQGRGMLMYVAEPVSDYSKSQTPLDLQGGEKIVGNSGREYTKEQMDAMHRTGSVVTKKTIKDLAGKINSDVWKRMAQGLADQFRPVKDIDEHAYTLLRLSKGATGAFEAFMQYGKLSIKDGATDADQTGGVLDNVFFPLGKETTDFLRWISGHRAERLKAVGRERLFTDADIAAFKSLSSGETDFDYTLADGTITRDRQQIYADSLKKFNGFSKNVLDIAEQSGLIDRASRALWEHEFYVPFYRVAEEAGKEGEARGMFIKGGVLRQEAFKKLRGGEEQLNDLLANTLMNWMHLIDASAKNRAALATLDAAEKVGAARKAVPGDTKTSWVMKDGQKVEYKVEDPYIVEALSSLEFAGIRGTMMDILSKPKYWLTIGVTASPFFKVRNLIRDSVQAIATASNSDMSYNPAANVAKGFKLTNRKNPAQEYVSALAGGGLIRFGTMLEGNEASRTRQLIKQGAKDEHILDDETKMRAFYDKWIDPTITAYNELGNRGEEVNRMALYDQMVKNGVSHAEASLAARDLMDFSMQGSWKTVRFLSQLVPFMNARIQGMYKLGRAAKQDKGRFAIVLGATAMASLALLAMYGDDDDWKKREDWDRDNYWWFKIGGIAYRIPKPFEIGAIATLAERTAELMFDDEMTGKRFKDVTTSLVANQLAMNQVPQTFKPMIDLYANTDSFTKRPIEPMGLERVDPSQRYTQSTSMIARGVSSAGNAVTGETFLSPVQIDFLVKSYFGWMGATAVSSADMLVRSVSNGPTKPSIDPWKMATGGMVAELSSAQSRYISMMYDQAAELEQAHATYNRLRKEGKLQEAAEYRADNKDKLGKYKRTESVKKSIRTLNERVRMIERSNKDPDEKKALINQIRARQDEIARTLYR